ncbi:MAG: class I SAM-dependent methyltransferase [Patescibacteria group bacterium]|jgi:SAM-dependent methyltransferase
MPYYKNFADGVHIKENNVDLKNLLAMQDEFESLRNKFILTFIPRTENIKVLEIGSGRGTFIDECVKIKEIEYFGIEPQENLCQKLRDKGYNIQNLFVPPLPFENGTFNAVVHSHVLEHMESPRKAYEFISECGRVIKKNGVLIFRCPNALSWGMDFWDIDYTHSFVTTPTNIKQLLYDCGFKIEYFEEISFFKPRHLGRLKYIVPTRNNYLNKLYPKISKFLGKFFKKDTELIFVCKKNENIIS